MIEQRTRVSGVLSRRRVDCDNILHQRRSDQSEQQRDDVVKVVDVSGAGSTTVLCADVQVACLCSVKIVYNLI